MHNELEQERTRRLALQHILETTTTAQTNPPHPRSPSKLVARHTHTTATQTIAYPPPTASFANTSTTTAQSTSWSQSQSEVGDSRSFLPSQSQDSGPLRGGTRSHAEVQMRLQAFSNPQSQVSVQKTNTHTSYNSNGCSSSSSLVNSSTNNCGSGNGAKSSGLLNKMQSKIEGSKSHLQSQQQVQFHQLMEQL